MGTLQVQYGILNFEGQPSSNPQIRNTDIHETFIGIRTSHEGTTKASLSAGDSAVIASTLRSLAHNSTTQFALERPISTDSRLRLRYTGTGTAPQFRTARNISIGPSTSVSFLRIGPAQVRLSMPGTNCTSVQVGDVVKFFRNTDTFTSPFSDTNQDRTYPVQAVGSNYLDLVDDGSAGLDTAVTGADTAFVVMSPGPIKVNDKLWLDGTFNQSNVGEFNVIDVAPDWVEFVSPLGVEETFLVGSNTVKVYDHLINFLHLTANGPFEVAFDGGTAFSVEGLGGAAGPIVFMGSVSTYQVEVTNKGQQDITVTLRSMAVE